MISSINNISTIEHSDKIYIIKKDEIIILPYSLKIYVNDMIKDFDYYFNAIIAEQSNGVLNFTNRFMIADYSESRNHKIVGFDLFDILCPSLPETLHTIKQYLEFSQLKYGDVVLDLGAYSGLSSIIFALSVGEQGKVISVEPDSLNYRCCLENFARLKETTTLDNINLINCAIWNKSQELIFSEEGCLGSHVVPNQFYARISPTKVQGFTLSDLTKHLDQLNFIKCDIEGAEQYIFDDPIFFQKFRPHIIIEPHYIGNRLNTKKCIDILNKYHYTINEIEQPGVSIPLLECTPK
jgi:FkbM family methyltransferase